MSKGQKKPSRANQQVLGMWVGENETSKFWFKVLSDLKNRGLKIY